MRSLEGKGGRAVRRSLSFPNLKIGPLDLLQNGPVEAPIGPPPALGIGSRGRRPCIAGSLGLVVNDG